MSVYVHYELACDHPDCFAAYQSSAEEVGSLRTTRKGATAEGWTRLDDPSGVPLDRCPAHHGWEPE